MSRYLATMTWPEVAEAIAGGITTLILPLGATEQHGPHLPLGTDTFRACGLAEQLATHLTDAMIAPAIPVGCSDEHTGFAGLLSFDSDTLTSIIIDLARRITGWGIRRLILLSAHGGNDQALANAVDYLGHELPDLQVWSAHTLLSIEAAMLELAHADGIAPEIIGIHAGEGETSEMLALCPDLVRRGAAVCGYTGDMAAILPTLQQIGLQPVTPNGILGDPRPAHAARGERYLSAQAAAIAADVMRK